MEQHNLHELDSRELEAIPGLWWCGWKILHEYLTGDAILNMLLNICVHVWPPYKLSCQRLLPEYTNVGVMQQLLYL